MIETNLEATATSLTVRVKKIQHTAEFDRNQSLQWSVILGKFLVSNVSLVSLRVENDDYTTLDNLKNIFDALTYNKVLKSLEILDSRPHRFSSQDPHDYAVSLAKNTALTSLKLYNIYFHIRIYSIAEALKQNTTLQSLSILGDAQMADQDLLALYKCLSENNTLIELSLSAKCAEHLSYHLLMAKVTENKTKFDQLEKEKSGQMSEESTDLIGAIIQKNEKIGLLEQESAELSRQLEVYNIKDSTQSRDIEQFKSQIIDLQNEIETLRQEKQNLEQNTTKLKEQCIAFEYDKNQLQEEIELLKEENERWKQQVEELKRNNNNTSPTVDIPFNDITLGERTGEGGFGEVLKAQWHSQNVAVKRIKHSSLIRSSIENLIHESRTVMRMHHKHVILSMGTTQVPGAKEIMLVMEYMKHGSLQDLLFPEEGDPVKLTPSQVVQIALDIAKGLNYLHCLTPMVIHLDLKCANILLYHSKTRAKISDFGTAKFLNKNSMRKTFQGTIGFIAPEVWEEEEHNEKADVYSFGIVLLVMLTSNQNLPMTRDPIKLRSKINSMLEAVVNSGHDALKKLILDCCSFNPKERPSMKECIEVLKSLRQIYARSDNNNND